MTAFRETERVSQQEPRAQGDIIQLEWRDGETGPPYGIIINADCDLAWGRTDGVIAFLPFYSFHDYLANFWASEHIQSVMVAETKTVLNLVGDNDAEGLHNWIAASGADEVAGSLTKYKSLRKKDSEKIERSLRVLGECLQKDRPSIEQFRNICAAVVDPASYARTHINAAKKALGDGHFFISDLVDHPSVGFVVRLRRIYTIQEQDCFTSMSDQLAKSQGEKVTAVRVAKLTELYRFKVLQIFAHQYSRIGLHDDVTALSLLAIDDLVTNFTGAQN